MTFHLRKHPPGKKRTENRQSAQPAPPVLVCGGGTLTVDGAVGCLFRSTRPAAWMLMVLLSPNCNPVTLHNCILMLRGREWQKRLSGVEDCRCSEEREEERLFKLVQKQMQRHRAVSGAGSHNALFFPAEIK